MIQLFLQFQLRKIASYFKTKQVAKIITILLFLSVFMFVGMGIYFFFITGFRYIQFQVEPEFKEPLLLFINEMFLLVLAGVIVFSSTISGIFTLFRGEYDSWILSSPSYKLFPRITFIKSVASSSWPLFVMFLPALLAFMKMQYASFTGLLFMIVSVVLFLIVLNAVTLSLIVLTGFLYYRLSKVLKIFTFNFRGMIAILVLLIVTSVTLIGRAAKKVDLVSIFKAEDVDNAITLATIGSHFRFLPSHPFALQIVHWQTGMSSAAITNFFVLVLLAAGAFLLWWFVSPLFYPLWLQFQEGGSRSVRSDGVPSGSRFAYHFTGGTTTVLFKKEALTLSRNVKGMLWSLFLLCLWLAELGISAVSRLNLHRYEIDITDKMAVLQAIQFIIAIYFMCAFVLRFVFPSFSVEKKTSWILASAPLSFKKIFLGKYFFYVVSFASLGVVMNYVNGLVLHVPLVYGLYSTVLLVTVIIFIVTLGLALGALFPSFETDDPESISTSMPGLFFTALSLSYGAVSAWLLYMTLVNGLAPLLFIFILATYGATWMLVARVLRVRRKGILQDVAV